MTLDGMFITFGVSIYFNCWKTFGNVLSMFILNKYFKKKQF